MWLSCWIVSLTFPSGVSEHGVSDHHDRSSQNMGQYKHMKLLQALVNRVFWVIHPLGDTHTYSDIDDKQYDSLFIGASKKIKPRYSSFQFTIILCLKIDN